MACKNCFNGCTEPVSDQCVKYTGPDVPELGIESGDQLSSVEASIIQYLVPVLTGAGIRPIVLESHLCNLVRSYLPSCTVCTGFTLNEIITAIIRSVCDLQAQIDDIDNQLTILNGNYTIGCLIGVTASSDTHAIVQAVINNLCSLNTSFSAFILSVQTNYVSVANINSYIAAYLATAVPNRASSKMVPFVPQAYYGVISNYPAVGDSFDAGGVGQNYWNKVYICNGSSHPSVPDLRGRVLVGAVVGVPGALALPADVNPSNTLNPSYTRTSAFGSNSTILTLGQIPGHNHTGSTATSTVTDPGHDHNIQGGASGSGHPKVDNGKGVTGNTTVDTTGITVSTVLNIIDEGGNQAHSNVQPGVGVNWIMYIP